MNVMIEMTPEGVDSTILVLGKKRIGKSSVCKEIVIQHVKNGAFVLVQDEFGQFRSIGLPWYASPAHYHHEQIRRQAEGLPAELAAGIGGADSEEFAAYALQCAEKQKAAGDKRVPYSAIVFDEIANVKQSSHNLPPQLEKLLAKSRHLNVALVALGQDVKQFHKRWRMLATDVLVFRTASDERVDSIAEDTGINRNALHRENSRLAPRWNFLHIRDEGLVST